MAAGHSLGAPADDAHPKAAAGHFDGHAENKHLCLMLARSLGLPAAQSSIMRFKKEVAIVVERYDRQRGIDIIRVHQEDACQALGVPPTKKYQNEGGPGVRDIVQLLRTYSTDRETDVNTFIDVLGFNWLIAGTDAHAKNYSLLLDGQSVRLAPLYDVASILPYDGLDLRKAKLAMKIGGEYKLSLIGPHHWRKLAREMRVDAGELSEGLAAMARRLPDEVSAVRARVHEEGLDAAILDRLAAQLTEWARGCGKALVGAIG